MKNMNLNLLLLFQYQRCQTQGPQSPAAAPSAPNLQWRVRQAEQGFNQHAQDC